MEDNKRAKRNKLNSLLNNELALIKGGKQNPIATDKPKTPEELITQP